MMTTTENVSSHTTNLPYGHLPRTFREAITVTRTLGLDYLWIDSLCIIQNSIEDWANEAAHMAEVYENAFVTISADAAMDSQTGFLNKPAQLLGPSASVPYELNNVLGRSYKGIMHIREKGPLMRQIPVHGWHPGTIILKPPLPKDTGSSDQIPPCLQAQDDAAASKLSTRGWVLQERLLSPRTLHFGPSELGWECRTCIKCECTATSARSRRGESLLKSALVKKDWAKLVKEYTRMHLTFSRDRLPAISGLASAMFRLRPSDRYLSGLWESTLADDLMWHVDPRLSSPRARFRKYYAPTWSWAHLIAPVEYRFFRWTRVSEQFKILEISYDTGTLNPFGPPLEGAFLRVRGLVVAARITRLGTGVDVVMPGQDNTAKDLPQVRAVLDDNHPFAQEDQPILFLMVRVGSFYSMDGLLLRVASGKYEDRGGVFERFGYAYARRGHNRPRPKTYSSDSSAPSEDEVPDDEAWPLWATLATARELKIV
jgi:Heterokaryon incompatibility protein (HET)